MEPQQGLAPDHRLWRMRDKSLKRLAFLLLEKHEGLRTVLGRPSGELSQELGKVPAAEASYPGGKRRTMDL